MKRPHQYNFTDAVRQALGQARTEAVMFQHGYVGTEHMLLGLIAVGPNVGTRVIEESGVGLYALRDTVHGMLQRGASVDPDDPSLPYTSRAKMVIELAMEESSELGHDYVGTQHLLLGLIREGKGIAAQALADAGIDLDDAREEVRQLHAEGVVESVSDRGEASQSEHRRRRRPAGTVMAGITPTSVLRQWLLDPKVAEVFAKHQIDIERLRTAIDELEREQEH